MALAFLFQQLRRLGTGPKLDLTALVVDHNHRSDSRKEAKTVSEWLGELGRLVVSLIQFVADDMAGIKSKIQTILWPTGHAPRKLSNFETVARKYRYQQLAYGCLAGDIKSLFLGHHLNDQVETIIYRLLRGQRMVSTGLSGIRSVSTIPCCDNIYGASEGCEASPLARFLEDMSTPLPDIQEARDLRMSSPANADRSLAAPVLISHGGISLYRPLLAFPKSRLIATCQANGVPSVTDPSNFDPTTTIRNAIRWLSTNDKMPMALRQESILRLWAASTSMEMSRSEKVRKFLNATQVRYLDIRSGRLVVLLPPGDVVDVYNALEDDIARYLDRLLRLVSGHQEYDDPLIHLINLARWMFPELRDRDSLPSDRSLDVPSRTARGVLMARLPHPSGQLWEMTRRPFTARENPEETFIPAAPYVKETDRDWSKWTLWDGRYWIRVRTRDPEDVRRFRVRALKKSDMENLVVWKNRHSSKQQLKLKAILREAAPGKLRYTLPVLVKGDELRSLPTFNLKLEPKNIPPGCIEADDMDDDLQWEVRYKDISATLLHLSKAASDGEDPCPKP